MVKRNHDINTKTMLQENSQGQFNKSVVLPLLLVLGIVFSFALLPHPAQAASLNKKTKQASTYNFYSNNGKYKSIKISSKGFAGAQCNATKLAKKSKTYNLAKAIEKPRPLYCITPATAEQKYLVVFYDEKNQASQPVEISHVPGKPQFGCYFVHSPDSPTIQGLNHDRVLTKNAAGACQKDVAGGVTNDPAVPVAQAPSKKQPDPKPKKTTVKAKDKVSVKKFQGLRLPPNFSEAQKDGRGYYLVPGSIKDEDYGTNPGSPPSNRYGTKIAAAVFYDTAIKYKKQYSKAKTRHPSKLVIGDFNASIDHASHCDGINFDVYSTDKTATHAGDALNGARSIKLAKWFIATGKVEVIFFNDPQVIDAFRLKNGKLGKVRPSNSTHDIHFHVRLKDAYKDKDAKPAPC